MSSGGRESRERVQETMKTQRMTGSCRLPITSPASLTPMVAVAAAATLGSPLALARREAATAVPER